MENIFKLMINCIIFMGATFLTSIVIDIIDKDFINYIPNVIINEMVTKGIVYISISIFLYSCAFKVFK